MDFEIWTDRFKVQVQGTILIKVELKKAFWHLAKMPLILWTLNFQFFGSCSRIKFLIQDSFQILKKNRRTTFKTQLTKMWHHRYQHDLPMLVGFMGSFILGLFLRINVILKYCYTLLIFKINTIITELYFLWVTTI